MVTRTPGPFEYFGDLYTGVTGDTIRAAAADPRTHANALQSLGDELGGDQARIGTQLEGDIEHGTAANAQQVKHGSYSLAALGVYATALVDSFATDVDAFDTSVDPINVDYQTRRTAAWKIEDDPAYKKHDGSYTGPAPESSSATYTALKPRWSTAEGVLDDAAQAVATKFHQGPKDANVISLVRMGLIGLENVALFPQVHLDQADIRAALAASPPQLGTPSAILKARLDVARAYGLPPREYATLLQTYWQTRSLEAAGINFADWDITKGAPALSDIISKVYQYYGNLYVNNPKLEWAGLANLVGPSFAGGFLDLGSIRQVLQSVAGGLDKLPPGIPLPPPLDGKSLSDLANLPESEVSWYEQKFLSMQKQIFMDMGSTNQAYTEGGMGAINEMAAAGLFEKPSNPQATAQTVGAWNQIDTAGPGDTQQLHEAATTMAYREQHDIIQDDYDQMRQRPVTGELVTAAFSTVGQVSVPGAHTMGQYDPLKVSVTVPVVSGPFGLGPHVDATASVSVPIATGNVADWNDRWDYFTHDTLPAYTNLLDHPENQPKTMAEIMAEPMDQRINDYRIYNRVDDLAKVFIEDTKVDVGVDAGWKW